MNDGPSTRIDRWGSVMMLAVTALLMVVVWRVASLQLAPDPRLARYVGDHTARQSVPSVRGDIVDRRSRLLATTRFGYRAFVDPTRLPDTVDETIVRIAQITGEDPGKIGQRIVLALEHNRAALESSAAAMTKGPETDAQARAKLLSTIAAMFADTDEQTEETPAPKLRRYVRVSGVLSQAQVAAIRALDAPGVHLERGPVREYTGGSQAASIVGKVGFDGSGLLGAELTNNATLSGDSGRVRYVRDAYGRPLWIEVGDYAPAEHGQEIRLSIDSELQRIATQELERGVETANAAGGRLVMLDPESGEVLAMVDTVRDLPDAVPFVWEDKGAARLRSADTDRDRYITVKADPGRDVHPALGRNRCVEDVYEPGSTFKAIVWSTVTELGLADPTEMIDTEGGAWRNDYGRRIEDVKRRDEMTWFNVLVNSSNIGMSKGAARASFEQLRDSVLRFGFGRSTETGLPGETSGIVTSQAEWTKWTQTSVSFGYEVAVTPLQMARAYAAFARSGNRAGTIPATVSLTVNDAQSRPADIRVLSPEIARLTRSAMAEVGKHLDETIRVFDYGHQDWSYSLFGKSGTAKIPLGAAPEGKRAPRGYKGYFQRQYTTSFIAGAPAEHPRVIVIVIIDDPGPQLVRSNRYYGSHVAGPVVRRVVERSLEYMGVPPSPGMGGDSN